MQSFIARCIREGMPEDVRIEVDYDPDTGVYTPRVSLLFGATMCMDEITLCYANSWESITRVVTARLRDDLDFRVATWLKEHSRYEIRGL